MDQCAGLKNFLPKYTQALTDVIIFSMSHSNKINLEAKRARKRYIYIKEKSLAAQEPENDSTSLCFKQWSQSWEIAENNMIYVSSTSADD